MRPHDYAPRPAHLKWLLDSDPAIGWQVMRDLTTEAPDAIAAERSRIATEGWGAHLLALQSPAGTWGGPPRGWRDDLPQAERGLLIALYSLVVLMDLGLDPTSEQAREASEKLNFLRSSKSGEQIPPIPLDQQAAHAAILFGAKQWGDARNEYSHLVSQLSGAEHERAALRVLECEGGSSSPLSAKLTVEIGH